MTGSAHWRLAETATREQVDALSAELARSALAEEVTLLHDPRWLWALADEPRKSVRAYVRRDDGALSGYVGFLVHPSAVSLALGELTLLSRPVQRLWGLAVPALAPQAGDPQEAIASFFRHLRADLAPREVVFYEAVIEDTPGMELMKRWMSERGEFHVLQNGQAYQHRSARLACDFEGYLKQLGSRTRADLRSTRKKFIAHAGERYRTRSFRTPEEVAAFAADAVAVSQKTYQYHQLGSGLRDLDALERRYRITAELGWFRSYILYVDDEPIAFQVGHVYRGRYHAQEIGYVPDWAKHHVGIFLHTEIVTDLCAPADAVQWFDFGIGDTQHKQRLSTDNRTGAYFYLIPDTWRGTVMANAMRSTNALSSAVGSLLQRYGLRQKARQLLRNLGAAR